jgi:hypothetical protein
MGQTMLLSFFYDNPLGLIQLLRSKLEENLELPQKVTFGAY